MQLDRPCHNQNQDFGKIKLLLSKTSQKTNSHRGAFIVPSSSCNRKRFDRSQQELTSKGSIYQNTCSYCDKRRRKERPTSRPTHRMPRDGPHTIRRIQFCRKKHMTSKWSVPDQHLQNQLSDTWPKQAYLPQPHVKLGGDVLPDD